MPNRHWKKNFFEAVVELAKFVLLGMTWGSGNASPLMACFACENFSAIISLWDVARIIFAGSFQSVAIMSRIA